MFLHQIQINASQQVSCFPMRRVEYRWLVMAIGVFILAVLALHLLRHDLNPVHNFVSEYAVESVQEQSGQQRWGWLMRTAFVAAIILSGILATAAGRLEPDRTRLLGVLRLPHLFWLSAAFTLLMMVCTSNAKEDASFQIEDFLHRIGVNGSFGCGIAAMGFVALQGRRLGLEKYTMLLRLLAVIGVIILGFHGWRLASPERLWAGLTERMLIGLFFLWALVLARVLAVHLKPIE
jgi:hypothetical protein